MLSFRPKGEILQLIENNVLHLHMLFLDGVYVSSADPAATPVFRRVPAPTAAQLQRLLECISQRIGRYLERSG